MSLASDIARSISESVEHSLEESVSRNIESVLSREASEEIERSIGEEVEHQVEESLSRSIGEDLAREVAPVIRRSISEELGEELRSDVEAELRRELQREIEKEIRRAVREDIIRSIDYKYGAELEDVLQRNRRIFEKLGITARNSRELIEQLDALLDLASSGDRRALRRFLALADALPYEDRKILAEALKDYARRLHLRRILRLIPILAGLAGAGAVFYMSEPRHFYAHYMEKVDKYFRKEINPWVEKHVKYGRTAFEQLVRAYKWAVLNREGSYYKTPLGALTAVLPEAKPSRRAVEELYKESTTCAEKLVNRIVNALHNRKIMKKILESISRELSPEEEKLYKREGYRKIIHILAKPEFLKDIIIQLVREDPEIRNIVDTYFRKIYPILRGGAREQDLKLFFTDFIASYIAEKYGRNILEALSRTGRVNISRTSISFVSNVS